ncbi:MAG: cysteine desulfurase [Elusimicrobia bacterium]|nr:cysteine desulfurase [Elusimicrobiota bacterium]
MLPRDAGIYLDNAATTRPDPAALEAARAFEDAHFGNPSSLHGPGVAAAREVERARQAVADALGAAPDEIVFTSGGTESNNLALKGAAPPRGGHVVVSSIEHPSVLRTADALRRRGVKVTVVGVDRRGVVSPAAVAAALTPRTVLVSVMHANNETGTIEPVAEIGRLCRERGVLFHTDACQSFTRAPLDAGSGAFDLISVNAHKIHGPKGVGALYVRRGTGLAPLLDGGGHERGLRSGTLNAPGIVGFGAAVRLARDASPYETQRLRDRLLVLLRRGIPGLRLNGPEDARLCGHLSVTLPRGDAKELAQALSARGVFVSTGSACAAGKTAPSHVLLALGLTPAQAGRTLRLTLSRMTTRAEVDAAAAALVELAGSVHA